MKFCQRLQKSYPIGEILPNLVTLVLAGQPVNAEWLKQRTLSFRYAGYYTHRDHSIHIERAWSRNHYINWTIWVYAKLVHFRNRQKYKYIQKQFSLFSWCETYNKQKPVWIYLINTSTSTWACSLYVFSISMNRPGNHAFRILWIKFKLKHIALIYASFAKPKCTVTVSRYTTQELIRAWLS